MLRGKLNKALELAIEYYKRAWEKNIPQGIIDFLFEQANCLYRKGDNSSLAEVVPKIQDLFDRFEDTISSESLILYKRRLYNFYGLYYAQLGETQKPLIGLIKL